jgi:hypothetical protein
MASNYFKGFALGSIIATIISFPIYHSFEVPIDKMLQQSINSCASLFNGK